MKEKVKLPERGKDKKSLFRQFNFWWCYHTLNYLKCSFFFLAKAVSPTENQGRLELIIFLSRHVRLLKKELTNHWKSTCCGSEPFFGCVFSIKKKERSNNYSSWYQWGWRSSKNHLLSSACCWQPSFFFFALPQQKAVDCPSRSSVGQELFSSMLIVNMLARLVITLGDKRVSGEPMVLKSKLYKK